MGPSLSSKAVPWGRAPGSLESGPGQVERGACAAWGGSGGPFAPGRGPGRGRFAGSRAVWRRGTWATPGFEQQGLYRGGCWWTGFLLLGASHAGGRGQQSCRCRGGASAAGGGEAVLRHLRSPRGAGAVGTSPALAGAGRAEQQGLFAPSPGRLPARGVPGAA